MAAEAADQPDKAEVSVFQACDRGHGAAPVVVRGLSDASFGDVSLGNVPFSDVPFSHVSFSDVSFSDVSWRQRNQLIPAEDRSHANMILGAPAAAFVGALLGCLATLYLIAFGIVPEIASALAATLLCSPVLLPRTTRSFPREFFPAVYGGTFGGMTPVLWLSDNASFRPALFISLSIVCALTFFVVARAQIDPLDPRSGRRVRVGFGLGYGGRSGAIATMASLLFVELASLFSADGRLFRVVRADMLDVDLISAALACAACAIGMSATLLALRRGRIASAETADKTFIASALALIGLITLHLMSPSGVRILDAFYAGCFLGMSTPERLKGWVEALLGVVVLTALLLQIRILLPGIGGSLGFAAFVTVAALAAARRMTGWTTREVPARDEPLAIAIPAPARGRLIHIETPADASTQASSWFEHWRSLTVMGGRYAARAFAALLAIGCVALAYQRMPEQPAPRQLVLAQDKPNTDKPGTDKPGTFEYAIPPDLPADNDDQGIATGRPGEAGVMDRGLSESGELRAPGQEAPDTAAGPAATADPAKTATKTIMGATAEGAAPPTAEPARSAAVDDHVVDPHASEQMFREFLEWRAARSAAIARPERQPAKRSRNPASQAPRPLMPVGSPASIHQVSARRSAGNVATNPVLGQSVR
jgi:hypothetical protein